MFQERQLNEKLLEDDRTSQPSLFHLLFVAMNHFEFLSCLNIFIKILDKDFFRMLIIFWNLTAVGDSVGLFVKFVHEILPNISVLSYIGHAGFSQIFKLYMEELLLLSYKLTENFMVFTFVPVAYQFNHLVILLQKFLILYLVTRPTTSQQVLLKISLGTPNQRAKFLVCKYLCNCNLVSLLRQLHCNTYKGAFFMFSQHIDKLFYEFLGGEEFFQVDILWKRGWRL